VSITSIDAEAPPALMVSVSVPSVSESLRRLTEMVATPPELITALPFNFPPAMSALLIPEIV